MRKVWQVVLIDIHPTSMLGTKLILEEHQDLLVRAMVSTGEDGLAQVSSLKPDLVLIDYKLPDGNADQFIVEMKQVSPNTHIVVMTDEDNLNLYKRYISLGASGMLSKQSSPMKLIHMISGLREGLASIPLQWLTNDEWSNTVDQELDIHLQLTDMEIFIMERIVQGVTYDKIANEIDVSRRSVDNYLRKIYTKLGVSSRAQAIEQFTLYSKLHKKQQYV
ncbi:response regulator transcription factor [Paenibacillus urinalis]|uniref:Response regulator transcription factor n=1 Tax=Paenibacillus urinalis TaxID=521520 RepID=A0AAX3N3F3_9BACL|nr:MULTISPECIES: response regulator transcription factor [Paenibacillus]WDH84208.1 response regulator transcription factor [Paenibacillus urinalis]WDH95651.1 response regulator transcription factor [Paenibacillus urinalis]WDI03848.1 response regulator transcription factor [Paenibacillus urinalis]GAK38808.1 LuxR family transcriptional regulator [Paenibacillus sp. TCA20]